MKGHVSDTAVEAAVNLGAFASFHCSANAEADTVFAAAGAAAAAAIAVASDLQPATALSPFQPTVNKQHYTAIKRGRLLRLRAASTRTHSSRTSRCFFPLRGSNRDESNMNPRALRQGDRAVLVVDTWDPSFQCAASTSTAADPHPTRVPMKPTIAIHTKLARVM
jgi:hypothetical protein